MHCSSTPLLCRLFHTTLATASYRLSKAIPLPTSGGCDGGERAGDAGGARYGRHDIAAWLCGQARIWCAATPPALPRGRHATWWRMGGRPLTPSAVFCWTSNDTRRCARYLFYAVLPSITHANLIAGGIAKPLVSSRHRQTVDDNSVKRRRPLSPRCASTRAASTLLARYAASSLACTRPLKYSALAAGVTPSLSQTRAAFFWRYGTA